MATNMRSLWAWTSLAMCLGCGSVSTEEQERGAQPPVRGPSAAASAGHAAFFDTLQRVLTGAWEGRYTNGTFANPTEWAPVRVEYRETANGTAIIENYLFDTGPKVSMTTVYHRDRDDLRLTHYCGARNHPSMIATAVDAAARNARFDFTHITNLAEHDDYHSRQLELQIVSDDHIRIQYHGPRRGTIFSQAYDLRRAERAPPAPAPAQGG